LDAVAFGVSLVGSVVAGLIAFSIRQTRLGEVGWRALALNVGPLVVGIAIACDYYAGAIELGLLDADYEQDMERWLAEERQYNDEHGIVEAPIVHESPPLVFDPSWAQAGIDDVRAIAAQMNGQRTTLTEDQLLSVLYQNHLRPREAKTVKRWVRTVREEAR